VCFGRENGLRLRVFGTEGAIDWRQEHPNDLRLTGADGVVRLLRAATEATTAASRSLTRLPAGHPEGYLEGFANVYRGFARAIAGQAGGDAPFPTVQDGLRGMRFLAAALRSAGGRGWVDLEAALA
jgi:predicted dehydrogenase